MTDISSSYDDLGRVSTTTAAVSDNKDLQTQYCYNIQGWTTRIGSELSESFSLDNPYIVSTFVFSQTLSYFTPKVATPSYSGNIAEQSWMYEGARAEHLYAFTYDALSRLKDATQYRASLLPKPLVLDNSNTERGITYDRNGNLLTLQRTSEGAVSNSMTYHYSGNKLTTLSDRGTSYSYSYDCMGNMTHDGVHNLDLSYNYLNLVKKVSQSGSTVANYRYLWDGTKVSATNGAGNGLLYQGSLVYNKQGSTLTPESISFSGGRIVATNNGLETHYFITDHLGSVRVVMNANGSVVERNDYYPYGMRWNGGELSDNRYRYNGKEEQKFVNIPYNDHGARMYDPQFRLQWNGVDMLSEITREASPLVFCANNPINAIDHDGRIVLFINGMHSGDGGGKLYWEGLNDVIMSHLNDHKAKYFDGSIGGGKVLALNIMYQNPLRTNSIPNSLDPKYRYRIGYRVGREYAEELIASLGEEETIKVITHSMGAAFAKGFIQGLIDSGVDPSKFAFEADFAPFQPGQQSAVQGVPTFQFSHSRDLLAGARKMSGAEYIDTKDDKDKGHKLNTFWNQVAQLPSGDYKVVNNKIIPIN